MKASEAAVLLTYISAVDNRSFTELTAEAWSNMIKPHIDLKVAKLAVDEFYADPRWADSVRRPWIMPADINARAPHIEDRLHPHYHVAKQIEAPVKPRRVVHHFAGSADFKGVGLGDVLGVSPHD